MPIRHIPPKQQQVDGDQVTGSQHETVSVQQLKDQHIHNLTVKGEEKMENTANMDTCPAIPSNGKFDTQPAGPGGAGDTANMGVEGTPRIRAVIHSSRTQNNRNSNAQHHNREATGGSSGRKPLRFIFYLDFFPNRKNLVEMQAYNRVVQAIKADGGTITEFLDASVQYVITSSPKSEWPPKEPPKDQAGVQHTEQTPTKPLANIAKSTPLKAIFAPGTTAPRTPIGAKTTSSLEKARRFGCRFIYVGDFLKHVQKRDSDDKALALAKAQGVSVEQIRRRSAESHPATINAANAAAAAQQAQQQAAVAAYYAQYGLSDTIESRSLQGQHIKIEDTILAVRPVYKEFGAGTNHDWPTLHIDGTTPYSPFIKPNMTLMTRYNTSLEAQRRVIAQHCQKSRPKTPANPSLTATGYGGDMSGAMTCTPGASLNTGPRASGFGMTPLNPGTTAMTNTTGYFTNTTVTPAGTPGNSTQQSNKGATLPRPTSAQNKTIPLRTTQQQQAQAQRRKQTAFCEICNADYSDLEEHIKTEKHSSFMKDPANYKELAEMLSSFKTLEEFLKEHQPVPQIPDDEDEELVPLSSEMDSGLGGDSYPGNRAGGDPTLGASGCPTTGGLSPSRPSSRAATPAGAIPGTPSGPVTVNGGGRGSQFVSITGFLTQSPVKEEPNEDEVSDTKIPKTEVKCPENDLNEEAEQSPASPSKRKTRSRQNSHTTPSSPRRRSARIAAVSNSRTTPSPGKSRQRRSSTTPVPPTPDTKREQETIFEGSVTLHQAAAQEGDGQERTVHCDFYSSNLF